MSTVKERTPEQIYELIAAALKDGLPCFKFKCGGVFSEKKRIDAAAICEADAMIKGNYYMVGIRSTDYHQPRFSRIETDEISLYDYMILGQVYKVITPTS